LEANNRRKDGSILRRDGQRRCDRFRIGMRSGLLHAREEGVQDRNAVRGLG